MPSSSVRQTKNKLASIYAFGIALFIAIFGFITLHFAFLARLKQLRRRPFKPQHRG